MARSHALWRQSLTGLAAGVAFVLVLHARPGQGEESSAPSVAEVSSGLPRISHSDTLVTFQALRFAPIPAPKIIAIENGYDAGILQWDMASTRSWLSATPAGATANSTDVAIWIVNTNAELGRHLGHLVTESNNAVNSPETVYVQL